MNEHILRWISQLSNLVVLLSTHLGREPSKADVLYFAERLEEMANNVRNRLPKEHP